MPLPFESIEELLTRFGVEDTNKMTISDISSLMRRADLRVLKNHGLTSDEEDAELAGLERELAPKEAEQ